jgi:hypothetical protein
MALAGDAGLIKARKLHPKLANLRVSCKAAHHGWSAHIAITGMQAWVNIIYTCESSKSGV